MDREAAVIRAEMSQTRADLDRKLTMLEARARELSPRRYAERYMPEFPLERAIGGVLTLVGLRLVWRGFQANRRERARRARVRAALDTYGGW